MWRVSLVAGLVLVAAGGYAQSISGISGDVVHEEVVEILGSGFGDVASPEPVVWDNVESGAFSSRWSSTNGLRIGTESRHANSSYCATFNFQGSGGDGNLGYFTGPNSELGESWYCQYWFKLDTNWDWGTAGYGEDGANLANIKLFRLWNPGSVMENFVVATMGYAGGSLQYTTENVSNPQGEVYFGNANAWTTGDWHLFQFEFKESSLGGNDGVFRWWVDGELFVDDADIMTRESSSVLKRPFILGFYDSWSDSGTDRDDFYMDDAYISTSWARVEIGNDPSYELCTHREVQVPLTWDDDRISLQVNTGSLANMEGCYLFVVKSDGTRSVGYALGEVDLGSPGQPSVPLLTHEN